MTQLGLDPGMLFVRAGLVAGWIGGWLTLKIVEHLIPDSCNRPLLYLLVMWGGGLLAVGKICRQRMERPTAAGQVAGI